MSNKTEKELNAYKIAGEALACYLLGFHFRNATIENGVIRISSTATKAGSKYLENVVEVEKLSMTLIFAALAEAKKRVENTENTRAMLDLEDAYNLLSFLCNSDKEIELLLERLSSRTTEIWNTNNSNKKHNWKIVDELGKLLLAGKILTFYDVEEIYSGVEKK